MNALVVAGGAGDIGKAIARRFAREGWPVSVWDVKTPTGAEPGVLSLLCDITVEGDVAAALAATEAELGQVGCLVNAAGLAQYDDFLDLPTDRWNRIIDVNLVGAATTTRAVLPGMLRRGGGTVINICSIWSRTAGVKRSAYIASKWGLLGLTKSLSEEFRGQGIQFAAISPGPVLTEMTKPFVKPEEAATWMDPETVAEAVWFAASPAGRAAVVGSEIELLGWGRPAGLKG